MHFVCFYVWNVSEQFQAQEHKLEVCPVIYQQMYAHGAVMSLNFKTLY